MADAKQASLTVLGGPLQGAQIPLPVDGVVTLGSAADCTFQLTTPGVSPLHARLVLESGRATVHSTGAEHPIHINDNPLGGESAELRNGDILWLGTPGEEDVVMLQCILAPIPEAPPPPAPAPPTPDIETQALWSREGDEAPAERPVPAPPAEPETDGATVAFQADDLGLPLEGGKEAEPPPEDATPSDEEVEAEGPPEDATVAFSADAVGLPREVEAATEAPPPESGEAGEDEPLIIAFDQPAEPPSPTASPAEPPPGEEQAFVAAPVEEAPPVEEEEEAVIIEEPAFVAATEDAVEEPTFVPPAEDAPVAASEPEAPDAVIPEREGEFVSDIPPTLVTGPEVVDLPEEPAPPAAIEPQSTPDPSIPTVEPLEEPPPTFVTPEEPPVPVEPPPAPEAPRSPAPSPPSPPQARPAPTPEAPTPAPADSSTPAAARPRAGAAPSRPATPRPRPGSMRRGPKPPPRPAPEDAEDQIEAPASRSPALLGIAGFVGVLLVAGIGFAVWRFVLSKPTPAPTPVPVAAATAAPPPVAPTPAPPAAPTPEAVAPVATPTPLPAATPTPAAPEPAPPTPTPRPTPTPQATPTPTPTPPPAPAPPQPSAAELQAQRNAARAQQLLGQGDTALAARQYDAAVGHYDEVLRLDPDNSQATANRARAVSLRDLARRTFVSGRTRIQGKARGGGGLAGFDTGDADLREAPEVQGRIEFQMAPPSGIAPGDAWTLQVFLQNQGDKNIDIQDISATTRVNGSPAASPVTPRTRRVSSQQRVVVGELSGTWADGTSSWSTLVTVTTDDGESLRASVTWR